MLYSARVQLYMSSVETTTSIRGMGAPDNAKKQ
jgi:hypothetical protein